MKSYIAFTKKEIMENIRTGKLLIMLMLFLVFGIMSPLIAHFIPSIFKIISTDGLVFNAPNPTSIDAYGQFFKNVVQMGLVVLVLVYSGMLTNEISKGTLINMLTKGLNRSTVIMSKYTVSLFSWTASFVMAFYVSYFYTIYLFGDANYPNVFFSMFSVWVFGAFLLALLLLCSVIFKSIFGGLGGVIILMGVMMALNIFPLFKKIVPIALITGNIEFLTNNMLISDRIFALIITLILTVLSLFITIAIFNRKKL